MAEIHEIHKTLCQGIDNKKKEDVHKVLDTICKVRIEKRKIVYKFKRVKSEGRSKL